MAENFRRLTIDLEKDRDFFRNISNSLVPKTNWPQYQAQQQAAMAALMKGGNVRDDYEKFLANLTTVGQDDEIEDMRSDGYAELQEIDNEVAKAIIESVNIPPKAKVGLIQNLSEEELEVPRPRTKDLYTDKTVINAATDPNEERAHQTILDSVEDIKAADNEIERMINKRIARMDSATSGALTDFTATALTPGYGFKIKEIVDQVLPEEGPAFHNIAPGEALMKFRDVMGRASPQERVELAKKILDATEEMAGLVWQNDFEQFTLINEMLGELDPSDSERSWERWMNNLFGVLDLVPLGVGAVRGGKATLRTLRRNGILGTTSETAPRSAGDMIKEALEDVSDETLNAAGATREEIVTSHVMPNPALDDVDVQVGPDMNARLAKPKVEYEGLHTNALNYTELEKVAARNRIIQRMEELDRLDSTSQLSKTTVVPIPGGFSARMVVGRTDNYGFSSVDELQDAVKDYLEVTEGASVDILKRNNKTGSYEPVKPGEATPEGQEYMAQVNVNHVYNPEDVLPEALEGAVIGYSGNVAKYLNKSSVFQKWVGEAGNVAAENRAAIKADLVRTMKPFNDLSGSDQSKIMAILDEGDTWVDPATGIRTGKWFSHEELVDKLEGDPNLIKAYRSVQEHQDKIYNLQNETLRNRLRSNNFKQIRNEESGYNGVAKPINRGEVEEGPITILDPQTKDTVTLNPSQVDELYAQGGYLARTPVDEMVDDVLTDLVVVRADNKTKMTSLPTYVLKKRPGYITRIYETTHIVKKKISNVKRNGRLVRAERGATFNGKPLKDGDVLVTVKMANNPAQAARYARTLGRDASIGEEFGVVRARELDDVAYANQSNYEHFNDKGQLFFSPRRNEEIESVAGERSLVSLADSLEIARNNAARHAGMDDILESMIKRWEKRYGKVFGADEQGHFPITGEIPRPRDVALSKDHADAVALRDHINMLAGIDQTTLRRNFRRLNIWGAERLAGMGNGRIAAMNEKVAEAILKNRDKNLIDAAKSLAFIKFIVLSPARQLILQAQQATVMLGLEHGFKYFASGKGIRDWVGLTSGLATIDRPHVWRILAPTAAKGLGMTTKEYKQFVEAFRRTGLPDSIDSHAFVQIMSLDPRAKVADSGIGRVAVHLQGAFDSTLRLARKVGFDAGEYANLSAAFLAVRNKWIKNNPGKVWHQTDNLAEITAQTRSVTFNMNAAGTLQQQKGLLGLGFQFMSHTTKAVQALIPDTKYLPKAIGKLSDKSFSNREKLRIFLTQMSLYGAGGLGVTRLYEKSRDEMGLEVPPDVNEAIEEGLAGIAVAEFFSTLEDEPGQDAKLAFSSSFGPFSGTSAATPLHRIIPFISDATLLQSPDFSQLSPPALAATKQIGETISAINFILNGVDLPEDSPSKWLVAAEKAMSVAPVYDNFLKARIASQIGTYTTRYGRPTVEAAGGEIMAKGLLGVRSKSEVQTSEILREITGTLAVTQEGVNRKIDRYAQTYASHVMNVFRQVNVTGDTVPQQAFDAIEPHITAMKLGLNEAEYAYFTQRLQERLFQDMTNDNTTRLSKEITRLLGQGEPVGGAMTTRIRNMAPFDGQEELIHLFNVLEGSSPLAEETE